jgi:uncharacterized protein YpmS
LIVGVLAAIYPVNFEVRRSRMLPIIITIAFLIFLAIVVTVISDREERRELRSASRADKEMEKTAKSF